MKKLLIVIVLLVVFANYTQAQMVGSSGNSEQTMRQTSNNSSKGGFTIYLGAAFPMGDFKAGSLENKMPVGWALDLDGKKGFAGLGINVGLDITTPINPYGLCLMLDLDYFYNGYNAALQEFMSDFSEIIDRKPRVMNIPFTIGLNFQGEIDKNFGIFAEAGVGPNLRIITPLEIGYSSHDYKYSAKLNYSTAFTVAFKVGAGMVINNHLKIALDYYGLGSAKIKGSESSEEWDSYDGTSKYSGHFEGKAMDCSELVVRLGYCF